METAKIKLLAITEGLLGAEAVSEGKIKKEAVTASRLGPQAVETAKIKTLAVTEGLLAAGAVSAAKLGAPTAKPGKPAEGAITVAVASPGRKVAAAIVGNGVKKEWVIEHKLETRLVQVAVQIGEAEEPGELESPSNYKVKPVSVKSVEVTFTAAPAAGKLLYITVVG